MSKQNRGRIIAQVGLAVVLLFIAMGLFIFRNKISQHQVAPSVDRQPAVYTGGVSANAVGVGVYYNR